MPTEELNTNQPTKREYVDIFYPLPKQANEQDEMGESAITSDQAASSKYNSEYPSVLTSFKIDSRLKNREPPPRRVFDSTFPSKVEKREAERKGLTKQNLQRLKTALENFEETPNGKANVEEALGAMGFAEVKEGEESAMQKREGSHEEDEDMEKGANAIRLVKETHVEKRKSKNNSNNQPKQKEKKESKETDSKNEKEALTEEEYEDEADDEEQIRNKRENNQAHTQNSELMKNLEKSGDLTVSGNKSPLASVGAEDNPKETIKSKSDKESESEEERVAREIQAKIDAIKDQVKRQIAETKQIEKQKGDRKKRDVNTLLNEENLQIDPQHNSEEVKTHVRRKRSAETPPKSTTSAMESTTANSRKKRESALNIPLLPYREEDEDVDEEDDEFEDDGFDDRTAEFAPGKRLYLRQPRVMDELDWENSMMYDGENEFRPGVRKKRHDSEKKQKAMQHLSAVRERSEMPKDYPKRNDVGEAKVQEKLQQIAEMSESDIFGPLPEGYEGELARYKRVKRDPLKDKGA